MDNIAQMITQPETVFIFVGIIVLVALIPLYQSLANISAVNRDLDAATKVLNELGKNLQDEFYAQFKNIHQQIVRIPGLRHAWREFVDSLYFESAASANPNKKVYLSHRPSHYFNRDSVLGTRLNLSQFLAFPNYLIGIGLTFTFIGLAAALHVAQAGLATGEGQQALKDLLAIASIKFVSSIVGIASSLFIAALQRVRIRNFQQKLDAFCDLLEDCTKYKSTEKLLHDSFSEQQAQTALLGNIGQSIGASIAEMIGQQVSAGVSAAFTPLAQELRALAKTFSEGSEQALGNMQSAFLAELRKASHDDMQRLMENTRALQESLGALAARMQALGADLDRQTKDSAARLADMLAQFSASFAPAQKSMEQMSQSLQAVASAASGIGQAGGDIRAAAELHQRNVKELGNTISGVLAGLAPMEQLLANLSQSLGKADGAAQHFDRAGNAITAAAQELKSSLTSAGQMEGRFSQHLKTLDALSQGLASTTGSLKDVSKQIDTATAPLRPDGYFSRLTSRWKK